MDSDEEYMSGLSTEGDIGGMVSDDGSFGDGMDFPTPLLIISFLLLSLSPPPC